MDLIVPPSLLLATKAYIAVFGLSTWTTLVVDHFGVGQFRGIQYKPILKTAFSDAASVSKIVGVAAFAGFLPSILFPSKPQDGTITPLLHVEMNTVVAVSSGLFLASSDMKLPVRIGLSVLGGGAAIYYKHVLHPPQPRW